MCPGWITGAGLLWLCSCREVAKVGCQAGAKPTATAMLAALVFSISGPWTKSTYAASAAYAKGCWGRGMTSQHLLLSQPAWPLCSSYGEVHLWALTCGAETFAGNGLPSSPVCPSTTPVCPLLAAVEGGLDTLRQEPGLPLDASNRLCVCMCVCVHVQMRVCSFHAPNSP